MPVPDRPESSAGAWHAAGRDLVDGLSRRWLWAALGWNDIRQRYSGSLLGSLWISANIALMVLCLTFIFAGPLGAAHAFYAPYVAISLVLWYFIQATLNEAANVFVAAADTIRHAPMPLSVHVLRLVWRNAIVLGHNILVVPLAFLIVGAAPGASGWLAVPGLLLLLVALAAASLLLGLVGARFRDVPQIVLNAMQLLFFVTPIFWLPSTLGPGREWLVALNPVFAFIDIVRAPLLGTATAPWSWTLALAATMGTAAAAAVAFAAARSRVAYWI